MAINAVFRNFAMKYTPSPQSSEGWSVAPNPSNNLGEQEGERIHKWGQSVSGNEVRSRLAFRRISLRTEFNLLWQSSTSAGLGGLRKGSNRQAVVAIRPSNPRFSAVVAGDGVGTNQTSTWRISGAISRLVSTLPRGANNSSRYCLAN